MDSLECMVKKRSPILALRLIFIHDEDSFDILATKAKSLKTQNLC